MLILNSKVATRVIFGLGMILFFSGLLVFEGWAAGRNYFFLRPRHDGMGFAGIVSMFALLGCREFCLFCRAKGYQPPLWLLSIGTLVMIWQPFWIHLLGCGGEAAMSGVLLAILLGSGAVLVVRGQSDGAIANLGAMMFGVLYLGLGGWFWVMIRLLGCGEAWGRIEYFVMFLVSVKACDVGAYFTGRFLGRHKMVPKVSPGKTWEGLVGGVALSMITASLFGKCNDIIGVGFALVFGLAMALTGQLGDLVESLLKRDAGAKDSASVVPQFGGVLDMIDSPLLAGPFAYWLLTLKSGTLW